MNIAEQKPNSHRRRKAGEPRSTKPATTLCGRRLHADAWKPNPKRGCTVFRIFFATVISKLSRPCEHEVSRVPAFHQRHLASRTQTVNSYRLAPYSHTHHSPDAGFPWLPVPLETRASAVRIAGFESTFTWNSVEQTPKKV